MSFSMFSPQQKDGGRPGNPPAASFMRRMQEEMYAARGTGVDTPLISESGPSGTTIGLERITLDLRRFVLTENLLAGSFANANTLIYDNTSSQWNILGESFTVWDSLTTRSDGTILLATGQYGFAKWFADNGLWEVVQIGDLISDDFFPAKVTSHAASGGINVYSWAEVEWTTSTAAATVKAGGKTGFKSSPVSWPATELNNNVVTDNTIVWMKRGFKPLLPAVAVISKTLAGNGAGVHAKFSLYLDQVTSGTFTVTMDGHTTTAIAYDAVGATVKAAIETATGFTLSAFAGAGTIGSPWTFNVSGDVSDHTASTNASTLKDGSGFRFDMGSGTAAGLCGWGAMPAATGAYKVVVKQDADDCLAYVEVEACTTPVDIYGGTGA